MRQRAGSRDLDRDVVVGGELQHLRQIGKGLLRWRSLPRARALRGLVHYRPFRAGIAASPLPLPLHWCAGACVVWRADGRGMLAAAWGALAAPTQGRWALCDNPPQRARQPKCARPIRYRQIGRMGATPATAARGPGRPAPMPTTSRARAPRPVRSGGRPRLDRRPTPMVRPPKMRPGTPAGVGSDWPENQAPPRLARGIARQTGPLGELRGLA